MVTHPSTNPAVHGWKSNSQPVDHKSDALTTTPPCHLKIMKVGKVFCNDKQAYFFGPPSIITIMIINQRLVKAIIKINSLKHSA